MDDSLGLSPAKCSSFRVDKSVSKCLALDNTSAQTKR